MGSKYGYSAIRTTDYYHILLSADITCCTFQREYVNPSSVGGLQPADMIVRLCLRCRGSHDSVCHSELVSTRAQTFQRSKDSMELLIYLSISAVSGCIVESQRRNGETSNSPAQQRKLGTVCFR